MLVSRAGAQSLPSLVLPRKSPLFSLPDRQNFLPPSRWREAPFARLKRCHPPFSLQTMKIAIFPGLRRLKRFAPCHGSLFLFSQEQRHSVGTLPLPNCLFPCQDTAPPFSEKQSSPYCAISRRSFFFLIPDELAPFCKIQIADVPFLFRLNPTPCVHEATEVHPKRQRDVVLRARIC